MIQNRYYKVYTLQVASGATYTDHTLDVGLDLAALAGMCTTTDRLQANVVKMYFHVPVKFKVNSLLNDGIVLDDTLFAEQRFTMDEDVLVDKLYFGINPTGQTSSVMVICYA